MSDKYILEEPNTILDFIERHRVKFLVILGFIGGFLIHDLLIFIGLITFWI